MKILELIDKLSLDATDLHPYLFEPTNEQTEVPNIDEEVVSCPFVKFSLEMTRNPITSTPGPMGIHMDVIDVMYCEERAPGDYLIAYRMLNLNGSGMDMYCVIDDGDMQIRIYKEGRFERSVKQPMGDGGEVYMQMLNIVNSLLSRLRVNKIGSTSGTGRVKYRDAADKKQIYKPKDVIYVSNLVKTSTRTPETSRTVNWTTAWDVSAHWRRLANPDSMGKDRYGNRNVKGYTFVAEHAKGEGKAVIKPRIVK